MIKVLFSSAGRRVALMNCFRNSAKNLGIALEILAVDMNPQWSPSCHIADGCFKVDHCMSPTFIPQMLDICAKHRVDMVIPTIDTELMVYAMKKSLFKEINTEIHIGGVEFVSMAQDKAATGSILLENRIPSPKSWIVKEVFENRSHPSTFPLLIKPRQGSCSNGVAVVKTMAELQEKCGNPEEWLAQEICRGDEYTMNCFYDPAGNCVACVPHKRMHVRDGEVCYAQTERIEAFTAVAHKFSEIFDGLRGCICFQGFKEKNGHVNVFEINARFGGGYPICDRAGGTFAKWILQDLIGQEPDYHDNWQEGLRMLRYDEAVFINS